MFSFFKSNKPFEPLNYESRKYFENNLLWLMQEFPEPEIENRKIFTPTDIDFPIKWNKSKENALEVFNIVCQNMQINPDVIDLDFYSNGIKEIDMGGSLIFMETDPDFTEAAGLYHHKKENNKYRISLDEALLEKPEPLIATIAHELSHVKLLGEKQLEENDELLTDFATVFFGFGIFNANTSYEYYQQAGKWGYSTLGYLKFEEWAYVLALVAFIRNENDPKWKKFLNKSIKNEFEKCLNYMIQNEGEIFNIKDIK